MKNFKRILAIMLAMTMVFGMVGCSSESATEDTTTTTVADTADNTETTAEATTEAMLEGSITGSGSSALLPLAQAAADKFQELNPDVSITLNGGGSGEGLKQVADGTVDIGNSDVFAEAKLEAEQAESLVDHQVCVVAMAPIVNNDVAETVESLTKQQLIDIFTAQITNWSEVGGPDEAIVLVTRPTTSGTRALFTEYALDGNEEAANAALETDDSGTLLQTVSTQAGAIGYVALSYLINNDTVSTIAIDGVEPTLENTYNGTYPVWGYEHMYTLGEATEVAQAFIDYMMSDEYSEYIEGMGYGVSSKMEVTR